jgi:hypothetical protein
LFCRFDSRSQANWTITALFRRFTSRMLKLDDLVDLNRIGRSKQRRATATRPRRRRSSSTIDFTREDRTLRQSIWQCSGVNARRYFFFKLQQIFLRSIPSSRLAFAILAIPATESAVERVFSQRNLCANGLKNRSSTDVVRDQCYLRYNKNFA